MSIDISTLGVDCTGQTDEQDAMQGILADYDDIYIPGKVVAHNLVQPNHPIRITGKGGQASGFIQHLDATGALLTCAYPHVLRDFGCWGGSTTDKRFILMPGTGPEFAPNVRSGLATAPQTPSSIEGLYVDGFAGRGWQPIAAQGSLPPDLTFRPHAIIRGNWITNCGLAMDAEASLAEYGVYADNHLSYNNLALRIACGNFNGHGFTMSANRRHVQLFAGANNGHGSLNASLLNHSTGPNGSDPGDFAIVGHGISNGFVFNGCQIHDGSIWLLNCSGVQISSGQLQTRRMTFQGGGRNVVSGNFLMNNPAAGLNNEVVHAGGDTILENNFIAAGPWSGNSDGWREYTPSVVNGTPNTCRYRRVGEGFYQLQAHLTANGGVMHVSLPPGLTANGKEQACGKEVTGTGINGLGGYITEVWIEGGTAYLYHCNNAGFNAGQQVRFSAVFAT